MVMQIFDTNTVFRLKSPLLQYNLKHRQYKYKYL